MVPRETTQDPPEETATVLLTGVQRPTRLWEMAPDAAAAAVDRHFALVDAAVAGHGAVWSDRTGDGDGVLAVFRSTAVRGVTAYKRRIAKILDRVPDLRLCVAEHASNGEFLFIRWVARDGGFSGIDRIQLRDGLVKEIRSFYDPALLAALGHDAGAPPPSA